MPEKPFIGYVMTAVFISIAIRILSRKCESELAKKTRDEENLETRTRATGVLLRALHATTEAATGGRSAVTEPMRMEEEMTGAR